MEGSGMGRVRWEMTRARKRERRWNRVAGGGGRRLLLAALVGGVLLSLSAASAGAAMFRHNPILFVHGIEGTGAQFESQAMRFDSNGYPANWIDEVDYN